MQRAVAWVVGCALTCALSATVATQARATTNPIDPDSGKPATQTAAVADRTTTAPVAATVTREGLSRPLRLTAPAPQPVAGSGVARAAAAAHPSVRGYAAATAASTSGFQTSLTFEGVGNTASAVPAQASIAVGPNDVFETVRPDIQIFSTSGTPLTSAVADDALWSGFGGPCSTNSTGDWASIIYDQLAGQWVFARPTHVPGGPVVSMECIAVSQTSDPTGSWYLYSFPVSTTQWSDYPQVGFGPNGYFLGVNLYSNSSTSVRTGDAIIAFDRAQLLAGQATQTVSTVLGSQYETVIPVSLEGYSTPSSQAEYFLSGPMDGVSGGNSLSLWTANVNWSTPALNLSGPSSVPIQAYQSTICSDSPDCGVQPKTSQLLESWQDNLMWPLAYRNMGGHQSIVGSFDVAGGNSVPAMQWFELRNSGSGFSLYQQGVYNPDSSGRYEQSAAMDRVGDIALGYTLSSSSIYPSLAYTGRLVTDPVGTLPQPQQVLWAGSGSQTGSDRWGDASSLVLGPDDCTFWYVNAYYPSTSSMGWHTRIGSFSASSCPLAVTTTSVPTATAGTAYSTTLSASGGTAPYTWSVTSGSLPTGLSLTGNQITGTPTAAGSSTFTVQATDSESTPQTATQSLTLTVNAAQSTSFAGYQAPVSGSTGATTSFVVPTLSCTAGTQGVSAAIVVDNAQSLSGGGVKVSCASGQASYTAFANMNGTVSGLGAVRAGDQISVTVTVSTSGATVVVSDVTLNTSRTATGAGATPTAVQVGYFAVLASGSPEAVPSFGSTTFTSTVNSQTLSSVNPFPVQRYSGSVLQIATGPLAGSFQATYQHS